MTIVFSILVFLHIVGAAMIVGYWIATLREPTVHPRQRDGAFLQLLTGIAMMGILPMMPDADPNHPRRRRSPLRGAAPSASKHPSAVIIL